MKKPYLIIFIFIVILLMIGFFIGNNALNTNNNTKEVKQVENPKTLIVYYSRSGNTKAIAELIQDKVGGDLIQIKTAEARSANYHEEVNQNEQEQDNDILPELKTEISNFESYDRVFIGAPTWNMALPQAAVAFLESYNFSGKTVIPFNTNGGYGEGSTFSQIEAGAKDAKVLEGFSVKGGEETNGILLAIKGNRKVEVSKEIDRWLKKINQQSQ
ncbi:MULTISPECIES: flavodoxin [unclassified Enterococcus]|uniref:flavodoxin n=1 Tax=unclassified Enterococcus TaxID=2608891 RepID=UPI0015552382|nr:MULTISPECIES: flavodoxin [unclassified Enterococcus]MBS7576375.1 flavodoxin [Enterococcus sp. MMGLQ5-2]MBS7583607.1 flavodoxin [Enterococcus sp. MMGLQ5-1]NPD11468.1 flavodoxin [Enterococcus sp. MMGLQ5-1]NPD36212.1 flavodoxin [Enterococcus sp. MMGLQ5-2]